MESVSNTIYSLFRNTPVHGDWIVSCLTGAWIGVLGDRIARSCRPIALRNAELVVEVSEKAWLPVLTSMDQELLQRIRHATGGEVRRLAFKMQAEK